MALQRSAQLPSHRAIPACKPIRWFLRCSLSRYCLGRAQSGDRPARQFLIGRRSQRIERDELPCSQLQQQCLVEGRTLDGFRRCALVQPPMTIAAAPDDVRVVRLAVPRLAVLLPVRMTGGGGLGIAIAHRCHSQQARLTLCEGEQAGLSHALRLRPRRGCAACVRGAPYGRPRLNWLRAKRQRLDVIGGLPLSGPG
jgi:hypothetical protein